MKLNYLNINCKFLRSAGLVNTNSKKGLVVRYSCTRAAQQEKLRDILYPNA